MQDDLATYILQAAICFRIARNSQTAIRDFLDMSGLQSGTIIVHMHTEIQDGGHECMWFYETLEQTYNAIIQIACKNAA